MNYTDNYTNIANLTKPIQRNDNFPLDRSSMFSSYEDAEKYIKGDGSDSRLLGATSYIGQIITVYENNEVKSYLIGLLLKEGTSQYERILQPLLDIIKVSNITIEESGAFILSENNTRYQIINNSNSNYELTITKNLLNELFYIELVIKIGDTLPEITLPQIKWVKPIEFVEDATYYIVIEKIGDNTIGIWTAVSNN